jgi:phosphatidylethanolamine/phosphatidyl-N-methylethanolamine N-methyltransferase
VDALDVGGDGPVVEIGPGTGPFTRELVARGVAPERLILVEFDPKFAQHLAREFPGARVLNEDARDLPAILSRFRAGPVRQMLSGLPFRSLPPEARAAITAAIGQSLAPGGVCAQFSYFNIPPFPEAGAKAAGLAADPPIPVRGNIPKAYVWRYRRQA